VSTAWAIRAAERRDVVDILRIEEAQFPEPWSKRMLLEEIANVETRRYRVATEGGTIVGYLGVMFVMDEVHINTIGVLPGHEGRGIATSLMNETWLSLAGTECIRATLEVAVSNERAQKLYYRYGFRPVGVRKNYYAKQGEDALILWADLTRPPTIVL
jgi:ribosomal-protein-alanine N-acetyltransferase